MKWAAVALCALLLAPLALVDVPPLLDYPNHLARAVVLASGSDPFLSRMYAAHWAIIPNLGTDLVLPLLLQILPVHLAGRIVLGIIILLPVVGTVAFSRATFGGRSAWPLASVLIAYNGTLLLGFMNFMAAIGIALLVAAGWIAWRDRFPLGCVVMASIGAIALFFCHLMGLLFLYVLIAGHELQQMWRCRTHVTALLARMAAMVPLLAVPLGLYLLSQLAPIRTETEFSSIADKVQQLALPFANYVLPLDVATETIVVVFLAACVATRRCRITFNTGVAMTMLAGLYLVSPWAFKGTFFLDTRFAVMLAFLLFAAVLPTMSSHRAVLVTVFTALIVARMAVVGYVWHEHQRDMADLRSVIATVEPGARVFIASVSPEEAPAYWRSSPLSRQISYGIRTDYHLAALLLIEHRAFWPFLFDNPSQQPVRTLQPYAELAERAGSIVDHGALAVPGKVDLCGFDYLLLLEAGGEPGLAQFAADRLKLLARADIAALFRISPAACAS